MENDSDITLETRRRLIGFIQQYQSGVRLLNRKEGGLSASQLRTKTYSFHHNNFDGFICEVGPLSSHKPCLDIECPFFVWTKKFMNEQKKPLLVQFDSLLFMLEPQMDMQDIFITYGKSYQQKSSVQKKPLKNTKSNMICIKKK